MLAIVACILFIIALILFSIPIISDEVDDNLTLMGIVPFVSGWIIVFNIQKNLTR